MDIRKSNIEGNNNFVIQGDNNTITLDNSFSANLMPQNESDEKTIRLLMHNMNVYLMDNYFQQGPQRINTKIITIYDLWNAIINSSTFCIYNQELNSAVRIFFEAWSDIVTRGSIYYSLSSTPTDYVFGGGNAEFDMFNNSEEERFFNEVLNKWGQIYDKYRDMIQCIKKYYVIDFNDIDESLFVYP